VYYKAILHRKAAQESSWELQGVLQIISPYISILVSETFESCGAARLNKD
jgi:hypothetical protein